MMDLTETRTRLTRTGRANEPNLILLDAIVELQGIVAQLVEKQTQMDKEQDRLGAVLQVDIPSRMVV